MSNWKYSRAQFILLRHVFKWLCQSVDEKIWIRESSTLERKKLFVIWTFHDGLYWYENSYGSFFPFLCLKLGHFSIFSKWKIAISEIISWPFAYSMQICEPFLLKNDFECNFYAEKFRFFWRIDARHQGFISKVY